MSISVFQIIHIATSRLSVIGQNPWTKSFGTDYSFDVWDGAMSCNKITLPCLLAHSSRFSINARFKIDHLLMIVLCVNGFTGFQEFIINNTALVLPDTKHVFFLPKRFGLGVEGPASLKDSHDFLHFGLSKQIHFSSPVTIRYRNDFHSWHWSSISQVTLR